MASYPDYDPSLWVGGMPDQTRSRPSRLPTPTILCSTGPSRASIRPASTFKPFVAAAALSNDLVTLCQACSTCPGTFRIDQQIWKCWKPEGHGDVNLVQALTESCDVYFYNLGKILLRADRSGAPGRGAPVRLRPADRHRPAGGDLRRPGARQGLEEAGAARPRATSSGSTGDEINLAIGQGDLLVTPLQMAAAFSAIANAGRPARVGSRKPAGPGRAGAPPRPGDHRRFRQRHPPVRDGDGAGRSPSRPTSSKAIRKAYSA